MGHAFNLKDGHLKVLQKILQKVLHKYLKSVAKNRKVLQKA